MAEKVDQMDPNEKIVEIAIERLRVFENHPFRVEMDSQMKDLQDSIKKYGIITPVITYKLKLSGGDIKAVQGDSGHAQADMVTEVYGHILDEDRKKDAQLIEDAFYKKENLNPDMKRPDTGKKKIEVPDGIDAEALMKVLNNPEMAALLAGLAKGVTV